MQRCTHRLLERAETGADVGAQMYPQGATLALQQYVEVASSLGRLHDAECVLLPWDGNIEGVIASELEEDTRIRSTLVCLPGRVQEARSEFYARRDTRRAEDLIADRLQFALVRVIHLQVGEQREVVAGAKSIQMRFQVIRQRGTRARRAGERREVPLIREQPDAIAGKERRFFRQPPVVLVRGGQL